MYVVSNRAINTDAAGVDMFGERVNPLGPNELRLFRATPRGSGFSIELLDDVLPVAETRELVEIFKLPIDPASPQHASLRAACDVMARARKRRRHILFFVHGYNNDMGDVLATAQALERRYPVEVVAFSWPANGGGLISGTASYLKDKRDARASTGALENALRKMTDYLTLMTDANRRALRERALAKYPHQREAADALYAELLEKHCPFTVNALYHSMGNYLLKQMLKSRQTEANRLLFDNIVLCQADTNNLDHALWVDRLNARGRVFVTINEGDFALRASRAKTGSGQLARLGHYLRALNSRTAYYINLSEAAHVRSSHSPFAEPADRNEAVKRFFEEAFSGRAAERALRYRAEGNWYEPR